MAYFDPDYFDGTYFDACLYFDGSYFDPTYFCANGSSTPPSTPSTDGHHAVGRTRRPLDDDELFALI